MDIIRTRYRMIASLCLFTSVFIVFFFVGYPWFLQGEDMGYLTIVSLLKNAWQSVIYGQTLCVAPLEFPSTMFYDEYLQTATFFSIYYRPVIIFFTYVQFHLFGLLPYCYYAVSCCLHAGVTTMLFNYIVVRVGIVIALLVSCFFAFHPTLLGWFGKLDTQSAQVSTLLGFGAFFVFDRYMQTSRSFYFFISWVLFCICLFSREAFIGFPLIVACAMLARSYASHQTPSWLLRVKNAVVISGIYGVAVIFYLLVRLWRCPPAPLTQAVVLKVPALSLSACWHFFYDTFWLQWFPWTTYAFFKDISCCGMYGLYVLIKAFIILALCLLFATNTRKVYVLFLLCAVVTFYWQFCFGIGLNIKQLYESLPFLAVGVAYLFRYSTIMTQPLMKRLFYSFFMIGIMCNACVVLSSVRQTRNHGLKKWRATEWLQQEAGMRLVDKPLLYMGTTTYLSAVGLLQTVWLKKIGTTLPQYFFHKLYLHPEVSYVDAQRFLKLKKISGRELRITSHHKDKVWMQMTNSPLPSYLRDIVVYDKQDDRLFEVGLLFSSHDFFNHMAVLVWFFQEEQFLIFDEQSL